MYGGGTTTPEFQSTLSVRRATLRVREERIIHLISIHALRKESDQQRYVENRRAAISIHALRKESDDRPEPS